MAFSLFGKKTNLGVDIGTSSIKAVELSRSGNRFSLENYSILDIEYFSDNIDAKKPKLPDEEVIAGLKTLSKEMKIKYANVITSVPSFSTFATVIEMPYVSENDLAKVLSIQARRYIPLPIENVVVDWSIINIKKPRQSGQGVKKTGDDLPSVEVFLVAVPKHETARLRNIFGSAGLNLKAIELENTALTRSLIGNDTSPIGILSVGGRSTSISVIEQGYERLSHDYEVGGFEITKSIARSLNISLERAEKMKHSTGLEDKDGQISEAVKSLVDMMAFEVKRILESYEVNSGKKVEKILITGGAMNMPGFITYMRDKIGRDVGSASPFSRVVIPSKLEQNKALLNNLSSSLAIAVGLAMRDNT